MQKEKVISFTDVDLVSLFGVGQANLNLLRDFYKEVEFSQRGNQLRLKGEQALLEEVEARVYLMIRHLDKYDYLTENNIINILGDKGEQTLKSGAGDEVLVYGNKGLQIRARTFNQRRMVDAMQENDMLFAIGPAGTGKTYTAVALAVRALKNKQVRKIILTRPAVEAGENLGFLPGDLKEKLDPYMQPLYDGLLDMLPGEKLSDYLENGTIQIAPLAFMRGRTLDNAFVILDESQNTTVNQMKMFLTRMGRSSKFVVTGDASQIDLPKNQHSGLKFAMERLSEIQGIAFVELDEQDVVRHRLVKKIIQAFDS